MTFYGVGLNTDSFFRAVGFTPISLSPSPSLSPSSPIPSSSLPANGLTFTSAHSVYHYFLNYSLANMFLSGMGLIPGYYVACALIDNRWVGRKRLQLVGFTILAVLFAIMGGSPSFPLFLLSSLPRVMYI